MLQATLERTSSPKSTHPRNDLRVLKPATAAEGRASSTGAFAFPSITNGKPRSPGQPLVELTCFPGGLVPRVQNIPST